MNSPESNSSSYVRDIGYHSKFVPAQAPILLSYVAANAGFNPPDPRQVFRYLELGCGSGATLNELAAACPQGEFVGVDFNGGSIAAARAAASSAALTNVTYIEAAFSGLETGAIAPVDYIACMGTYSWLSQAEKAALIRVLQRCLRDGGLLYLGFVSLGRVAVTPMWQILRSLVPDTGQCGLARVTAGIGLLGELRDQGAGFLKQNPQALALLNDVHAQYQAGDTRALTNLSHNLLAEGFHAQLLDEVAADLQTAGLGFCGSSAPHLNDPDLSVPPALRIRHDALPTRVARELFKDFLMATVARTDVFIKGAQPDADAARHYSRAVVRAALVGDPAEVWQQLERPDWTTFSYATPVIRFVFQTLAAGSASIDEIVSGAPFGIDEICSAFGKLVASPGIELCLDDAGVMAESLPARIRPASGHNQLALKAALAGVATVHMAAPGLGSSVPITLPGSLLVAEFCRAGLDVPVDVLHATLNLHVACMRGIDAATIRQFGDPRFFLQLHRIVRARVVPLLLRFGACVAE